MFLIKSILIMIFGVGAPSYAVTTKMFKVLDTCARYRLGEISSYEAIERLKLKYDDRDSIKARGEVSKYCSVFTPNEKIEF